MYPCRNCRQPMASVSCSTGNKVNIKHFSTFALCFLLVSILALPGPVRSADKASPEFPMDPDKLISLLSESKSSSKATYSYPYRISYTHVTYDMNNNELREEDREIVIEKKPQKIIPQAVGITEILWTICPRERIIAFHKACTNPEFSFIADEIPSSARIFSTEDAEIVIGLDPDLVLITYYTNPEFKNRLDSAGVEYVETGYFGDIASIERQIKLIGRLIGEEVNANLLVHKMQTYLNKIRVYVEKRRSGSDKLEAIYYDERGYVAGENTNFDSMCRALNVVNSASKHGIERFQQVEHEQILKWDPNIIIIPEGSNLDQRLYSRDVLSTARAIKNRNIKKIPAVYLYASSQFIIASINYLAGILYAR